MIGGVSLAYAAPMLPTAQAEGRSRAPKQDDRPVQSADTGKAASAVSLDLTEAEQEVVTELKARDREVRDHEQAHARVGGPYAGEPSYTYQTGPDGQQYAVGGEVAIDVSPVPDDPEATISKMEIVKRAALAPAEPSSTDRRVAAEAEAKRMAAMADLMALRAEEKAGQVVDIRV